jgi:predicted CoA-binding protein
LDGILPGDLFNHHVPTCPIAKTVSKNNSMKVLVVRRLPVMMIEGVATTVEISGALKNSSKGKERKNMTHMTREETLIIQLLNRARTIAVVGASPRPERHSHTVVSYLHRVGYDVIPVRPDLQEVDGLKSYARLADIPVQIDLAVIFRRPDAAPPFIAEAASKGAEAVWLPPGVWTREAEEQAREHDVLLIKDRCIEEEHRHMSKSGGRPKRLGVHLSRRRRTYEDNRKDLEVKGYTTAGGGGGKCGGGKRAVLDEKKMVRAVRHRGRARASAFPRDRPGYYSREEITGIVQVRRTQPSSDLLLFLSPACFFCRFYF